MTNFPLVSIIIVSLNRKTELLNCIESINSQTYKNYEILLIDNNSDDNSSEIIKLKFPNTKVYKTYKNLGTSYTRNAGIKFSEGEIICVAKSSHGVVMSIEHKTLNIYGIMWHPEREKMILKSDQKLFKYIFNV